MQDRPKSILDQMGVDVEVSSKDLGSNIFLSNMLKDMGTTIKPREHEYLGSFCTHIYKTDLGKEIAYAHHHHFGKPIAEGLVSMACSDLALHLMKVLFGRKKPATRDKRDKR